MAAIRSGRAIITDTHMARSGIRKTDLKRFGVAVKCFMDDPEIHAAALATGGTRAAAAVDAAATEMKDGIYVVGNAPTALLRLVEQVRLNQVRPALIVGLPVGFVNAAESKAALAELDHPFITNTGRKGGSNVAAAVVNALLLLLAGGKKVKNRSMYRTYNPKRLLRIAQWKTQKAHSTASVSGPGTRT